MIRFAFFLETASNMSHARQNLTVFLRTYDSHRSGCSGAVKHCILAAMSPMYCFFLFDTKFQIVILLSQWYFILHITQARS